MTSSQDPPATPAGEQHDNTSENPDAPGNPGEEPSDRPEEPAKETKEGEDAPDPSCRVTPTDRPPAGVFLAPHGNSLGNKIESGLSPVGKPLGKGLEVVGRPVGGLVEPIVGGLLKSGGAYGEAMDVGAGNTDKRKAEEKAERHAPVGGKEQTGENPLGLA